MIFIQALFIVFKYVTCTLISVTTLFACVLVLLKVWLEPRIGICRCKTKLHGKTALVTGATSGIGLETARDLARRGARVIIASRNETKCKEAVVDIIATTGNKNVEYRQLNLCKFSSIKEFAGEFNKTEERLDILVNNAGCAVFTQHNTEDGFAIVMQTNHFGPFLLTNLLTEKLVASAPSRIVIVSSYLHNFGKLDLKDLCGLNEKRHHYMHYCNSKLCNVLWAKALAKKLPKDVTVNSLHPGFVQTEIFRKMYPIIVKLVHYVTSLLFKNAREGAQTTIHLCVSPEMNGVTGEYYKDCKPHPCHKLCRDDEYVEMFWNKCMSLTSGK